jgi:hypothetical protein
LSDSSYIIRIALDRFENQIYGIRTYYVGLRRDWSKGSKLIFVKKSRHTDDGFIGSGIIDKTFELNELNDAEKKYCIENNWYKKIVFGKLVKFYPQVLVKDTSIWWWSEKGALLHGAQIADSDISKIERLVTTRIIT